MIWFLKCKLREKIDKLNDNMQAGKSKVIET